MDFEPLRNRASIAEELLGHLRGRSRLSSDVPLVWATYDTTFTGCYRVEIAVGRHCRLAIEHVGGDGAFDWSIAEDERRRPGSAGRAVDGPVQPPTADEVRYRAEEVEADAVAGRDLIRSLQALDWGEATPEDRRGRDGVVMSGGLVTDAGVRWWTTRSPEPAREPAKAAFFGIVLRFAVEQATGDLADDLARVSM